MEKDSKANKNGEIISGEERQLSRRDFLAGLGKWSKIVIGAALVGDALMLCEWEPEAYGAAWANRGGGSAGWVNRHGGGAWANHGGGGGWVNRY